MSLKVENLEKNMVKLTIETSAEELEKAIQGAYLKNRGQISVPGFRKGKVPRQMIEKMYGPSIFYEDAANAIIPDAYEKAAEESGLEIVSQPKIDVTQLEKGKPFVFTAEVAVKPEVTLGKYKGVEIEKSVVEATEEEVLAELDKAREQNSRLVTVEGRPIEKDDQAIINYEGFVDGVAFEGGKDENFGLTIGSGQFIPGFEEQLIGANVSDEVEVKVTFPEEYHAPDLAGKEAVFKVVVNEIKKKELPELDDEFAEDVSDFDTLVEYKDDIKAKIIDRKEKSAATEKENAIIDKIIEDSKMEIPEAMIETQTRQLADDFAHRLQHQGLTLEQYFQFTGLTAEKFVEDMKPQAVKRIETRLVLEAISKAEDIQVTDEEFEVELNNMAASYQMEVSQIKEFMGENEKKQINQDVAVQKAVDLVVKESKEV
ncbi:MAG: trigger factor [Clostridiales bacterium]|nr:trigger factor [Clostridiales bacterium]